MRAEEPHHDARFHHFDRRSRSQQRRWTERVRIDLYAVDSAHGSANTPLPTRAQVQRHGLAVSPRWEVDLWLLASPACTQYSAGAQDARWFLSVLGGFVEVGTDDILGSEVFDVSETEGAQ